MAMEARAEHSCFVLGCGKACGNGRPLKWLLASFHTTGSPATCSMGSRNEAKQQKLI